nr:methyltransferase domain-containing protein [Thermoleophilaceae bacterium]
MSRAAIETWDRNAPHYDAQERLEARALDTAHRLAGLRSDDTLVDVGTGTGLLLRRAAAGRPRPARAIGVDRSEGMLAEMRELPAGWSVVVADAAAVPLDDGCADVVTCA